MRPPPVYRTQPLLPRLPRNGRPRLPFLSCRLTRKELLTPSPTPVPQGPAAPQFRLGVRHLRVSFLLTPLPRGPPPQPSEP